LLPAQGKTNALKIQKQGREDLDGALVEKRVIPVLFVFKKIIALLSMPLSIAGMLFMAGLMVLFTSRRQMAAKVLLVMGVFIALGSAWAPVADRLLAPLENRHPPLLDAQNAAGARHVAVLGGGHNSDARLPDAGRLSDSSLARMVEGIRLHRQLADSRLIFTGGAVFDPVPHARVMALAAASLGVDEQRIVILDEARDTAEEAAALKKLLGQERFVLVTSASHMPRAMLLFQAAGMHPVAAPADYLVKDSKAAHPGDYFPSAAALRRTERAVYEYLGLLWARVYEVGRWR